MYGELPKTGLGMLILTAVALVMAAGGWVVKKVAR